MDDSTRPSHTGRERRATLRYVRVAAFLVGSAVMISTFANAAAPNPDLAPENEQTGSVSLASPHEFVTATVVTGQESIVLRARLTDAGPSLAKNVAWKVLNAFGEVVLDATSTEAEVPLPPGSYVVEAQLGAIRLREAIDLQDGKRIELTFVLNAGGIRILPRVKSLALPEIPSRSVIYALSQSERGKPVFASTVPGEIISLAAGRYRIESQIGTGNSVAVTDVIIKAGIMSSIDIDHKAGLARLSYVGAPDADVRWDIRQGKDLMIRDHRGLSATVVLQPGEYTAVARVGDEELTAKFKIEDGQARDIMLGN